MCCTGCTGGISVCSVVQDVLKGTMEELRPKASQVEDARKDLDRAYTNKQKECAKGRIQEIERAHESYKTSLAWPTVNEISGRKGSSAAGFVLAVQRNG